MIINQKQKRITNAAKEKYKKDCQSIIENFQKIKKLKKKLCWQQKYDKSGQRNKEKNI